MMKKLLMLLLPVLCLNCTDSGSEAPIIKIIGIYLDGDETETNYMNQFHKLPGLEVGDNVDILFSLKGNGDDLRSFIVSKGDKNEATNQKASINTILVFKEENVISPEFSDPDNGKAVFVDGVDEIAATVKVKVVAPLTEEQPLSFHLSSTSPESSSAVLGITLKANPVINMKL